MLLNVEKVIILKQVSIFSQTKGAILSRLADEVKEVFVQKGETIIRKGEEGKSLYIIVEGTFTVHTNEKVHAHFKKNDFFGELSALVPEKRIATVTAETDGLLLSLDHESLKILMKENFGITMGIIEFLAKRLREEFEEKNELLKNS